MTVNAGCIATNLALLEKTLSGAQVFMLPFFARHIRQLKRLLSEDVLLQFETAQQ
jgi:hypothetical protein